MFTQQATLIRSDLFLRLNGFDEGFPLGADTDFWIRAIAKGARCHFIDKVCAAYRVQPGQLGADPNMRRIEIERMLAQYELKGNSWPARLEEARFRFENSRLYLTRILKNKGRGYKTGDLAKANQ